MLKENKHFILEASQSHQLPSLSVTDMKCGTDTQERPGEMAASISDSQSASHRLCLLQRVLILLPWSSEGLPSHPKLRQESIQLIEQLKTYAPSLWVTPGPIRGLIFPTETEDESRPVSQAHFKVCR